MPYKQSVIDLARQFYVLEGKSHLQISETLGIPLKTVYNWAKKFKWDEDIKNGSSVSMYMEMQKQFQESIKNAVDNKLFADPSTADSLWKTAKLMEKMAPQKMMLSNIFSFLHDLTDFVMVKVNEPDFLKTYQALLPDLGDYLRKKYTSE